jgi:hypothetical protein
MVVLIYEIVQFDEPMLKIPCLLLETKFGGQALGRLHEDVWFEEA